MRRFNLPWPVLPAVLLLLACLPAPALWKSLKSDSFILFFPSGRECEALRALQELEACRPFAESLVGARRALRLPVVLVDAGTESNGFADPAYRRLHLYLYPPSDSDLGFAPDWWGLVGLHEYVHWLHLTAASGPPRALAWAFGDAWAPGVFSPAWLVEGLAVYAESAAGPYQGRLNAGTFDAYLEARLRDGRPPSLPQALFVPPAFPGGDSPYLYGGEFLEYLVLTYGQDAVTRFLRDRAGSALSYLTPLLPLAGLDRDARRVFGKRTPELWREWLAAEAESAAREPEVAGDAPPASPASQVAWWLGTPVPHDGKVFFLRSLPYPSGPFRQSWRTELRELGPEGERTLARFASTVSADLKWREDRLYFALRELERGLANTELLGFGAGSVLYRLDPATGRRERVLRAPLRAYEVLPGGDVVFARDRPEDFGSEVLLWKSRPEAGEENPRPLARSAFLVREILAREGRVFVSARRDGENFGLYSVDPVSHELRPILPSPYSAGGLDYEGGELRFAANYGGRFAVYACGPDGSGLVRLTPGPYAVSPALDPATGLLWYVGLNAEGYALYNAPAAPQPAGPPAAAGAPGGAAPVAETPAATAAPYRAGGYGPNLLTLAPRLLLPVLATDTARGSYLAGAEVLGRSALGDIAWSVTGLVDMSTGAPAVEAALDFLTPPLAWGLAGSTLSPWWLGASVQLPVVRRLTPVARGLSLGLAGFLYGHGFPGRALQPFLAFDLGWPLDSVEAELSLWLERVEWGAAANRALLQADLAFEHFFRFGALRAAVTGFTRLDGAYGELEALRGNAAGLTGPSGAAANLDFFVRLLQIRAGTWNPPLFIQDVYVVPFVGAALAAGGQSQVAAGLELRWELKTLAVWTGLPLELIAGLAVNGNGAPNLYLNLESDLEGLPLAGAKLRRMP
jgi:hypothetical protein